MDFSGVLNVLDSLMAALVHDRGEVLWHTHRVMHTVVVSCK